MLGEAHGVSAGHRSDDAVTLPAASGDEGVLPSTSVPTVEAAWGGKRFRKRGPVRVTELVRLTMQTVKNGKDGEDGEFAQDQGEEIAEEVQETDELFDDAIHKQAKKRAGPSRRR